MGVGLKLVEATHHTSRVAPPTDSHGGAIDIHIENTRCLVRAVGQWRVAIRIELAGPSVALTSMVQVLFNEHIRLSLQLIFKLFGFYKKDTKHLGKQCAFCCLYICSV